MTDDDRELRARLARLDPARRPHVAEAVESRTAHEIRERAMQTVDHAEQAPTHDPARPRARRARRAWLAATGAAAAVVAVVAATAVLSGDDRPAGPARPATTLTLRAPGGGTSMQSCVAFDVAILREMPVAFAGTVTAVTSGSVTLDVDRWYKGGDADVVTVANSTAGNVSIDGVEFTEGARYLVTATDGEVNACGFTGPATPELERAFEEAFATP